MIETGIMLEIAERYVEAAEWYQDQIDNHFDSASADTFINLGFLYWSFGMNLFEFVIPYNIPDEWTVIGIEKYNQVWNLGLTKFKNNTELIFWIKYVESIWGDVKFTYDECVDLVNRFGYGDNIVPYFKLFNRNHEEKYKNGAQELYHRCIKTPTAKNSYIKSILDNYFNINHQ
jgi:hypothetical protein